MKSSIRKTNINSNNSKYIGYLPESTENKQSDKIKTFDVKALLLTQEHYIKKLEDYLKDLNLKQTIKPVHRERN